MIPRHQFFRLMAGDVMRHDPLLVAPDAPCVEVVAAMTASEQSAALVVERDGGVIGILTERDVAHRVAYRSPPETPVGHVMTTPVQVIRTNDYLYAAIAAMRRQDLRHMPVVERSGELVGLLALHDAQAVAANRLMDQIDRISADGTMEGLRTVKDAQVQLAADLLEDSVPGPEVQLLLTDINRDIYRRVVANAVESMAADGKGEPPVGFEVLVLGSGGRGENFLFPDQDNGFILEDYPDAHHTEIDGWFIELADRMTQALDEVGFPLCRGNVMATNPIWRKTISQWLEQTRLWGGKRNFIAARLTGIFFDFRAIPGPHKMAHRLRQHVTAIMGKSSGFLKELYEDEAGHGTPLGWFNRLITVRDDPAHRGQINLKHTGTLPFVECVRLMALKARIPNTSSLARLRALAAAGHIDYDRLQYLETGFTHITTILLRRQIADFQAGRNVGNFIDPEDLSRLDREQLIDAFRSVEWLRGKLRSEFTADVF